ncbi:Chaplin OS=Streptomyces microflavus OX=1919 GN=HUT09_05715 PE=4 SV=1 [Streptomyces microflavus]
MKPPVTPETPVDPPATSRPSPTSPGPQLEPEEQLAQTGAGGMEMLIPASAGLLLAGLDSALHRRSRSAA